LAKTDNVAFDKIVVEDVVRVAVRVRPVPLMALKVPAETVRSPTVPFHVNVLPGSSEKVKVTKLLSTLDNTLLLIVILTVGAVVSTL
jgi:hypothetical protein